MTIIFVARKILLSRCEIKKRNVILDSRVNRWVGIAVLSDIWCPIFDPPPLHWFDCALKAKASIAKVRRSQRYQCPRRQQLLALLLPPSQSQLTGMTEQWRYSLRARIDSAHVIDVLCMQSCCFWKEQQQHEDKRIRDSFQASQHTTQIIQSIPSLKNNIVSMFGIRRGNWHSIR